MVMKRTKKMSHLFDRYAEREGVDVSSLRFVFNGDQINCNQTAEMLGLKDYDQIDCLSELSR
jgi:small ubiquitin-related modifier